MHYGPFAFAKNPESATIEVKGSSKAEFGQRRKLSYVSSKMFNLSSMKTILKLSNVNIECLEYLE